MSERDDHEFERLAGVVEGGEATPADLAMRAAEQRNVSALLRSLASEAAPPTFAARVAARLEQPRSSWLARLLFEPIELRLRLNVATIVGLAAFAGVAAGVLVGRGQGSAPAAGEVVFALFAPGAKSVAVAGDFNRWEPNGMALSDADGDGVWLRAVQLEPGRYEYMFVVDGKEWVTDPRAPERRPDGFGRENAVLEL